MPFRKAWAPSSFPIGRLIFTMRYRSIPLRHFTALLTWRKAWKIDFSCKRDPYARIRRILLNILLNISQERRQQLSFAEGPAYLRILGFRKEREGLLHRLSQSASLPVITNLARQFSSLDEPARSMLEDEIRFTDLYMGHMPNKAKVLRGLDLTQPLLIWRS